MPAILGEPALQQLFRTIATATATQEIYDASLACLEGSLGVHTSSILLFDGDGVMRFHAWRNLSDEYRAAVEGHSPWSPDAVDPDAVLVSDVWLEPSLDELAETIAEEGIRALAFIPLTLAGRLLGKFMLYYPDVHEFSEEELSTARVIASHVAFAIDQARLRDAVEVEEHRYRELVESMGLGLYATDAQGYLTDYNEAAAELWGRRPTIGVDMWCGSHRLYHPDGRPLPHEECPFADLLRGKPLAPGTEVVIERPDGSRIWVAPYPSLLRDPNGKIRGALNVMVDITARKQAELKLAQSLEAEHEARERADAAVRARNEFLAIASHELRNPITVIRGAAQRLMLVARREQATPEQVALYGDMIDSAGERLGWLVDDLLDVGRLENGKLQLRLEEIELAGLVREVAQEYVSPIERLLFVSEGDLPPLDVDPERIRQVLGNLIGNATKYAPEGPIRVSVLREGDSVLVRVEDSGTGIPPEELDLIFEPFARAANASGSNTPGMGLGLYISRRLAEAHGGSITAESNGIGTGSTFTLMLPLPHGSENVSRE